MAKAKVTVLSNPVGLMVNIPILDWESGIKVLLKEARIRGITPECIACEKLDDNTDDPILSITLWGC